MTGWAQLKPNPAFPLHRCVLGYGATAPPQPLAKQVMTEDMPGFHDMSKRAISEEDRVMKTLTTGKKAALTRKRRAAGKKAGLTKKRRAAGRKAALTKKRNAAVSRVKVIEMRHTDIHHALRFVGYLSDDSKTDKAAIMMVAERLRQRVASGAIEKDGSLYRMKIKM